MEGYRIPTIDPHQYDSLIVDTTAFVSQLNLNAIALQHPDMRFFITDRVLQEVQHNKMVEQMLDLFLSQKILTVLNPTLKSITTAQQAATASGDIGALSATDIDLIGLWLDLHNQNPSTQILLVSDDYSVQNTCAQLHIPVYMLHKPGIQKKIYWEIYCPHCYHAFPAKLLGKDCSYCGTRLKRRAKKAKKQ